MNYEAFARRDIVDAEAAIEQIAAHLEAYDNGGPDMQAASEALCVRFEMPIEPVKADWAERKAARAALEERQAKALRALTELEAAMRAAKQERPSVGVGQVEPVLEPLSVPQPMAEAAREQTGNMPDAFAKFRAWLNEQGQPKVEVRAEPKIEPEPEPRADPEPAATVVETGRVEETPKPPPEAEPVGEPGVGTGTGSAQPQGKAEGEDGPNIPDPEEPLTRPRFGELVLSWNQPQATANEFILREHYSKSKIGVPILKRQGKYYYRFNGTIWEPWSGDKIQSQMADFMSGAKKRVLDGNGDWAREKYKPPKQHVTDAVFFVETDSRVYLDDKCRAPMWLNTMEPAPDWIVFSNKIVNVRTGEARPKTPNFWAHSALPFDWDPKALCPKFDQFLEDVFAGDKQAKELLEEWFGYCVTWDTNQHKALMMVGPTRCGKGTICHLAEMLVGADSCRSRPP
jgi:hypothetical protein